MNKHILVISQYFYPEQFRINDICSEWIKKGYQVTVITGIPNYPKGKFYQNYGYFDKRKENYNGMNILRLPIIPRGNNAIMLVLNYISFVISGFIWSQFTNIKADYVFIFEVSPMTQALPGIWYSKRLKIPCYLYVTDLWPENVEYITGIKNKFIINSIGRMVDYIYNGSSRIFTSSLSFVKAIEDRKIESKKIEFWPQYAEDYYVPKDRKEVLISEIPQDGVFNIIFAGNIGVAQGLEILPQVARMLKNEDIKVRFNLIGDGRFKNTLISLVQTYEVNNYFNFIGKQDSIRIPDFMAACDATLISLSKSKVFSITLPAKTQSCLACGIPIIVSADGEVQDTIREAKAGVCSDAGDVLGLTQNIKNLLNLSSADRKLLSENAIVYSNENFNKVKLLKRMDKWFN